MTAISGRSRLDAVGRPIRCSRATVGPRAIAFIPGNFGGIADGTSTSHSDGSI